MNNTAELLNKLISIESSKSESLVILHISSLEVNLPMVFQRKRVNPNYMKGPVFKKRCEIWKIG